MHQKDGSKSLPNNKRKAIINSFAWSKTEKTGFGQAKFFSETSSIVFSDIKIYLCIIAKDKQIKAVFYVIL